MEMNCNNRTVFIGDNREVMLGLNADIADAIITDPPFNTGQMRKDSKIRIDKKKSAELEFPADEHGNPIQHYSDKWNITDIKGDELQYIRYKDEDLLDFCSIVGRSHSSGMEAYLLFMADRLLLCHEILKETGSIFLHCDHSSNGYLRMLMDAIFGEKNFRNEIIWCYTGPAAPNQRQFSRKHDTILWYSKSDQWTFNSDAVRVPHKDGKLHTGGFTHKTGKKSGTNLTKEVIAEQYSKGKIPETWWSKFSPVARIHSERCQIGEQKWTDQKPLKLYTRLVKAVTNKGDLVIDPFCGCATTLIAAENLGRQWIGIDSHKERAQLIRPQMEKLITSDLTKWKEDFKIVRDKKKFPKRTDNKLSAAERKIIKDEKVLEQLEHLPYLRCDICGTPKDKFDLEIEHIQAKANRGGKEPTNFQLACSRCNRRKGSTKTTEQVRKELRKEGLLHEQRVKIHAYTGIPMPHHEEYLKREEDKPKKKPPRRKPKEDLNRRGASRQPEMGL